MLWLILNSGIRTKLLSNPESGSGQVLKAISNNCLLPLRYIYFNPSKKIIIYPANKDIPAHTEIIINYSGEYGEDYSKWFLDRGITPV